MHCEPTLTMGNLSMDFNPTSSVFSDYYCHFSPGVLAKGNMVCLICACDHIEAAAFQRVFIYKSSSQNMRSHIFRKHNQILDNPEQKEKTKNMIKKLFPKKTFFKFPSGSNKITRKKNLPTLHFSSESITNANRTNFFKNEHYDKARVLQSLWIMTSALPSTIPDNQHFKNFVGLLNTNYMPKSKDTELRIEQSIFGFCFKELKKRLKKSWNFFKIPFLTLQADAWTAQSNLSLLGISVSFYDLNLKKSFTALLACEPLIEGKTASELTVLIKGCLAKFEIDLFWIHACIGDEEGAVQNALKSICSNTSICMAHKLQTMIRHAFALGKKPYKKDPFHEGFDFFQKVRALISFFTKSPMRLRQLKKIQAEHYRSINQKFTKNDLLVPLKFSGTRWSGAFQALGRLQRLALHIQKFFSNMILRKMLIFQVQNGNSFLSTFYS